MNDSLTLAGIPPETFEYRLGSRSALEWVIDQYQVKGDSDPNREDDPSYIVRLAAQAVRVSIETTRAVFLIRVHPRPSASPKNIPSGSQRIQDTQANYPVNGSR